LNAILFSNISLMLIIYFNILSWIYFSLFSCAIWIFKYNNCVRKLCPTRATYKSN